MNQLFTFITLDPRKGPEQLPAEQWARTLGIEVTRPDLAAACGLGNIDPQHGNSQGLPEWTSAPPWQGVAAVHLADEACRGRNVFCPPAGSTIAFLKPDVDSVAAAAVFVLHATGLLPRGYGENAPTTERHMAYVEMSKRVMLIAERDGFSPGAEWRPRPLPTVTEPWPTTAAPVEETESLAPLGVICSPAPGQTQWPLAERVMVAACWLLWGDESGIGNDAVTAKTIATIAEACGVTDYIGPRTVRDMLAGADMTATQARLATARAIENSEARPRLNCYCGGWNAYSYETSGGYHAAEAADGSQHYNTCDAITRPIAVVDYGSRGALGLGYCIAPRVIATGLPIPPVDKHLPSWYPPPWPRRKFTVAAWSPKYIDFPSLLAALNAAETEAREAEALEAARVAEREGASAGWYAGEIDTIRSSKDLWGGNLAGGILGSPQGSGSALSTERVIALVTTHAR